MELSVVGMLALTGIIVTVGLSVAVAFAKGRRRFSWIEYILLASIPLVTLVPVFMRYGVGVLGLFIASIIIGLFFEHILGYVFHRTLKRHMWRYYRMTWGGYTSLLVAPFWGMAGIFFFLLAKAFGL